MSAEVKRWLGHTLNALVGVQAVIINPAPGLNPRSFPVDLRVMLWTGVLVHIYLLDAPLKTRSIRQLIQQETNDGTGVLFILAPHLLPRPDEVNAAPEWLLALQALAHERLYSYTPDEGAPLLLQVHLERLDATERYKSIYGPPVYIEKLHFGRISVKPRFIRGYWLTAHFGGQAFWEQEARSYVPPSRRQYQRPSTPPPKAEAPQQQRQAPPARPAPQRRLTQLDRSYELLGIDSNASEEEVKIAFRRRVFSVHPDVSALPKHVAEERFRTLAEAYEYIKARRGWT